MTGTNVRGGGNAGIEIPSEAGVPGGAIGGGDAAGGEPSHEGVGGAGQAGGSSGQGGAATGAAFAGGGGAGAGAEPGAGAEGARFSGGAAGAGCEACGGEPSLEVTGGAGQAGGSSGQGGAATGAAFAGGGAGGSAEPGAGAEPAAGAEGARFSGGAAGAGCEACGEPDCVDLGTSVLHCGACDRPCAIEGADEILCEEGLCLSTCAAGRGNCLQPQAPAADNGCETDLEEDINNCGACGRACLRTGAVDGVTCSAGRCVSTCLSGFANVVRPEAPAADDGCEVDLENELDHCGSVGRACSETGVRERRCEGGVCVSTCASGHWNVTHPAAPAADDGCEAPCPAGGGPSMVRVPEGYCIDSTEVTQGQYQAWLEGAPTGSQPAECAWNNAVYEPTCDWTPETKANYPVVCVDWCDAYAYCAGVGKRLCGRIGGGATGYSDYADASQSQWYHACVSGLADNTYPYGDSYEEGTCNGSDYGEAATVPVGSLGECQSTVAGYAGVYDLSGNVREWEDSCDGQAGSSDYCRLRGGSFYGNDGSLQCGGDDSNTRGYRYERIGFRCCAP